MQKEFDEFLVKFEQKVIPLSKEANLAYFQATTSGEDSLYRKMEELQIELSNIFASKEDFSILKNIKESDAIQDLIAKRQLDLIYNQYLGNQIDRQKLEQMIRMQTAIEQKYSTFRAVIDGQKYSDNEIEEILRTSKDSRILEKAWKASKQVGQLVADDVLQLVSLRNEAARELGFENYHSMQLRLAEQDPVEIEKLFDELDSLTRDAFMDVKKDIDGTLSEQYRISIDEMMPWHYQNRFFQEAPRIYNVDLDKFYRDRDIVDLTRSYYEGIGLPIDDLIASSDLFEREGKYQHAYCTDIDREGDVRVVCNVKPTYNWMNTMLHEFGHAVYDKFNDRSMPWTLRGPAHAFTTEAIAMMFGGFASDPSWLRDVVGVPEDQIKQIAEDCHKSLRLETLVFSRWAQVMYRFEKSMYANPDQDLNNLWWDLVEKYQMIKRPTGRDKPDWAAKIHVALYPAYYHNYLLGNILASQFYYSISREVLQTENPENLSISENQQIGQFLIETVFKPGNRFSWNEMIERATGEKLTARYYARQFVN
ncbi:MAG: M2 family metallopeptidase [Calditrichaeota bacterium]|nr:M2 family metallopeptidase [Calditrichota bacterium]